MPRYKIKTAEDFEEGEYDPELKESLFLLTVSTNKRPSDVHDAHNRAAFLETTLVEVLAENNMENYIMATGDIEDIEDIDIVVAPELGQGRGGAVHAHVIIDIKHRTKVRLDLDWIRQELIEYLVGVQGIKNVHVDLQVMKGGYLAILNYARKQTS